MAGATNWFNQNDGVYSSAFECVSDCSGVYAVATMGHLAVSAARVAGGNGCTNAAVVCRGCGEAGGENICRWRNQSCAEWSMGRSIGRCWSLYAASRFCRPVVGGGGIENNQGGPAVGRFSTPCPSERAKNLIHRHWAKFFYFSIKTLLAFFPLPKSPNQTKK